MHICEIKIIKIKNISITSESLFMPVPTAPYPLANTYLIYFFIEV